MEVLQLPTGGRKISPSINMEHGSLYNTNGSEEE